MADRIPLIVNSTAGQIQELGVVDPMVGITTVTISGAINASDVVTLSKSSGTSLVISSNQASSNKTSGAVTVVGGVGISGALHVGGDITAFDTSDMSLKENLVAIPNAVDKVGILTGYTFKWKADGPYVDKNGREDTGIIAQQVQALGLPGITSTRDAGILGVSYKKLVPLLIEAIKELKKENDDLKTLIKDSTSFQNLRSSL